MVKWRINTLSPQEIEKYRQRSVRAINGLNYCRQNAHIIAQYEKVADKYKTIANCIGLGQEGGNSYYNYFVPTDKNIVFLLRNANHNNLNPSLYDMHEQLGRPNKRFVIFFKNGNTFSDVPVVFQESEHHVIPYNVNALDNEASIIAYIDALIKLFQNGKTKFPNLPIVTENKQYKTNTDMNKKLIRLTESDLHRIVKESVKRILKETDEMSIDNMLNIDTLQLARQLMSNGRISCNFVLDETNCKLDAELRGDELRVGIKDLKYGERGFSKSYGEEFEDEYDLYYSFCQAISDAVKQVFPYINLSTTQL